MFTNVKAITVFNSRTDSETRRKKYIPTVLHGVSYTEAKGATVANNGVWSNDVQYKIRVPMLVKVQDRRTYEPDLKYAKLNNEEAVKHWTICKGDLICLGEYTGESLLYEDEIIKYTQEHGINMIRIKEFADNTFGSSLYMRHWRIGGT